MDNRWQVRTARARFRELIEKTVTEGPQIVTRRGVETAVVAPIELWRTLERAARPNLKELLLAPEPRSESLAVPRRRFNARPAPRSE